MSTFQEEFERRKYGLQLEREVVTTPETPQLRINYKKLFIFSVFLNLFLIFIARSYFSILGTAEYGIHHLEKNSNLSMHQDYLKRVQRKYCK